MQILLNEIKKILTWKILLLLCIVNSILYFLFIEFYITYFPNGRPALDSYNIGIEMIDKYGIHMDEEEFLDFKKTYETQIQEANGFLQSRKEFIEAGIDTYDDFLKIDLNNEEQYALHNKVYFDEKVDTFWELQEKTRLIEFYESKEVSLDNYKSRASAEQKVGIDELIVDGKYPVYPEVAVDNFKDFIFNVAVAIILSVLLALSPVFIKDRLGQILHLQYTAKKGRNLYKIKAAAGLISTFVIITTLLVVYFGLYSLNNTSMFFKVPLHMFIGNYSWYDPTFFQYILLLVVAIYLLGFIFALLAMSFSSIMPNYIALIGIQIPLYFALMAYGLSYLMTQIISIWVPQWIVPTAYSVMIAGSILFMILMWKREKSRDIVE